MSRSSHNRAPEDYRQDYIASLRYRNDLPPPDMPPKFLDIPHEGLERFLTPGFASNLARREEPNIDVDAEGGMPIDLVGIPGLQLGDESGMWYFFFFFFAEYEEDAADCFCGNTAIMVPENQPPVDPADVPLLLTLDQLRNPAPKNANVSFLRRTQYISATTTRAPDNPRAAPLKMKPRFHDETKASRDDPVYIKKYLQKGFDIAYPQSKHTGDDTPSRIRGLAASREEADAWAHPVHPTNPKLKPVGFYPMLPDLQGFPDPGGYVQFKFDKAPVQAIEGKRDERMDIAILHPSAPEERVCQEHAAKVALHNANPKVYADPGPIPYDYDIFLPNKNDSVKDVASSLRLSNPDRDNESYYADEGTDDAKFHRYDHIRTYATNFQTLNTEHKQKDVALTLFDHSVASDELRSKQNAAYYYPILGKTRLKPERARTIAQAGLAPTRPKTREDQIDQMQVTVRDPNEAEVYKRSLHRAAIDPKFAESLPPPPAEPSDVEDDGKEKEGPTSDLSEGERSAGRPANDHESIDEEDRMSEE